MKAEKLVDQLELYSNSILGFIVVQSVGFSFTFGTTPAFSCEVTRYKLLAAGLLAHFLLSTLMAAAAIRYLGQKMTELSRENTAIVLTTCRAKIVIVILFALIPMGLVGTFGLFGNPTTGRCAALASQTK